MAEYAKKKNDELAALCKERGLAHTGKKADLVKRLEEDDSSKASNPAANEDEIDWDEEPATETAKTATTEPAAAAIAAGGKGQVPNPLAVPNQEAAIDPSKTDDLTVESTPQTAPAADPAETEAKKKEEEQKKFGSGIAERTLDEEIEKRKARARKFGMAEDSDEIKALERAKKFGSGDLPGLLNRALPEKQDRKRGREGPQRDGGIRKQSHGRPAPGRRHGGEKPKNTSGNPSAGGSYPTWMTDKDREAAERRKAKFA